MVGIPLFLLLVLAADDKPTPKFPLGKETTYITEPLDKDGYLDYEAALNERLGKGIKPEKNANVLLWKALGPRPEGGVGMPPEFFKRLGIDEPPLRGAYFIELGAFARTQLNVPNAKMDSLYALQDQAIRRPWDADETFIALWLKANEKPLVVVVEATKLPDYYNPLVSTPVGGERVG